MIGLFLKKLKDQKRLTAKDAEIDEKKADETFSVSSFDWEEGFCGNTSLECARIAVSSERKLLAFRFPPLV